MEIKNIKSNLFALVALILASFALFAVAQEKSGTANNIFLDSDQDGLSDQEENSYGTDPKDPDTDGDSYGDETEIKSGYNPLIPAPGDKVIKENESYGFEKDEENLTKNVAQKISNLTSPNNKDQEISLSEVSELVNNSLNEAESINLPEISKDEIKIKRQNYANLSEKEKESKKKEDFLSYIVAVYYILSSNSPEPITSDNTLSNIMESLTQDVISAVSDKNPESMQKLSKSGEKILEQMKEVEVPENLVDVHIKGLQFSRYAMELKNDIEITKSDPLSDLTNLTKIQAFLSSLMNYSNELQTEFGKYGLEYNSFLEGKLEDLGAEIPQLTTDEEE